LEAKPTNRPLTPFGNSLSLSSALLGSGEEEGREEEAGEVEKKREDKGGYLY
jgi:hypothetical protein